MLSDEDKRQNSGEPPNGGLRAWSVALGAFAAQMCTFGYINTFGIFQSYYSEAFLSSKSASAISWIGSLQAFFLFLLGAVSGPMSDRLGVKAVIIPASITLIFSVMMTSLSHQYYQFILGQGVLGGMACGLIFTPVVSCVGQYFTTRRALAMGVVVSGAAIGGIVFPVTLNRLLNHHNLSFDWSVRIIGFIMLVLLIYACLVTREFSPRRQKDTFLPSAFKSWPYNLTNAGFLLALLGLYTPMFYIADYALEHGMSSQMALYQVAIFNAPSFFGRTIPNFVGDKIGRFNMTILTYASCAVLLFCWTAATSNAAIMVWIAFFGFFSGAAFSLYSPTVAQVCPNTSDIGTYIGQGLAICSFGALGGTPINGALIRNYGYLEASMFSAAMVTAGLICQIIARFLLERRLSAVV
ncbi:putative monocarboxylate transporter [Aspergillus heterothallicus]